MTDLVDALLIPVAGVLIIPAGLAALLWLAHPATWRRARRDWDKRNKQPPRRPDPVGPPPVRDDA